MRYTANGAPELVGLCHCTDCQKHTGSAFAIMVRLPKTELQIQETFKTFSSLGDSGNPILRYFCPDEAGACRFDQAGCRCR